MRACLRTQAALRVDIENHSEIYDIVEKERMERRIHKYDAIIMKCVDAIEKEANNDKKE